MADSEFSFTGEVRPICQLGMSASRQAEPDSWLDISCYVHECELFSGRSRFTDRFEPGTCSITFTNENGWADLVGSPSMVANQTLRPGRPIRIGVLGPWGGLAPSVRWLWRGWIDQTTPQYDPVAHDVVVVNCIDAFGEAGTRQAPTGPFQGANETVQTRVHRVLDAVEWFGTKRKIEDVAETVQGTSLGGAGSDLMSQAADSAGGVVYGDTDGDVVLRNINWMLYDPDTPPDGTIGNVDPGSPGIPFEPGYIDPTKGYVYWPDPPPLDAPTVIAVCAKGPDGEPNGSLVAQGDSGELYVDNGQLFFASSGHVWNLGDFPEGGCVGVTFDPDTGEVTRIDDPGDTGVWEVAPFPAIEVPPPPLTVELLAWSDGGLAEGPLTGTTVGPITPGAGCMLVTLVNGMCDAASAVPGEGSYTALFPSVQTPGFDGHVTGGGFDWIPAGAAQRSGDGAESYALAGVPRTDPGTFSVICNWLAPHRSRYHLVTVWKVTGHRQDLFERMRSDIAAYLWGFSSDEPFLPPSNFNPPGKGFFQLEFATGISLVPSYTRLSDITIAQSLAESPTPPFGAQFNETDGPWVIPSMVPVTATTRDVGPVFTDDFERADGPLGANWAAQLPAEAVVAIPLSINSGAVVVGVDPGVGLDTAMGLAQGVIDITGDPGGGQYVEVVITNVFQTNVSCYVELYAQANPSDPARNVGYFSFYHHPDGSGGITVNGSQILADGTTGDFGTSVLLSGYAFSPATTFTLRFESLDNGVHQCLINGAVIATYMQPGITGPHGAFGMYWQYGDATSGVGTSPRVNSFEWGVAAPQIKASWIAGTRANAGAPDVKWQQVNFGPDNIQSTQSEVVMESGASSGFGWGVLDYNVLAEEGALLPPGSRTASLLPEPNSVIVVFVGVMNDTDVSGSINVTSPGLTFTRVRQQGKTDPLSHGQGAIFWAKTSKQKVDYTNPPRYTVSWGTVVEKLVYTAYQVTNAGGVGATAGATRGTHVAGSVNGGATLVMPTAPAASSVVLGFINVGTADATEVGATPGAGWVEELEYLPLGQRAWFQLQSRTASTDTFVVWDDMQGGGLANKATDAVLMAIEVTPGPDFAFWQDDFAQLVIGGSQDAFNGSIYSATRRSGLDPNAGEIIWAIKGPF